jgi:hypothetical protein
MVLVLLPFWTSILVKLFTVILGEQGIINSLLRTTFRTLSRNAAAVQPDGFHHWHGSLPFAVHGVSDPGQPTRSGTDMYTAARVMGWPHAHLSAHHTPLSMPECSRAA